MSKFRRIAAILTPSTLLSGLSVTGVFAKITEEPVACETKGGGLPRGQQPGCKGEGLEQETENQNPAAKAPAGQNK